MKKLIIFTLVMCFSHLGFSQSYTTPIPKIVKKNDHYQLLVDGKPFFILGGQAHNSSGWPAMMPAVWRAIKQLEANTLEEPVYWEQLEPQEGTFDFSLLDTLLTQARAHNTRLVLLWFATWKNGSNHYMPQWMKLQPAKFPNINGKDGKPVDSPSPHVEETLNADMKAFTRLMGFLKTNDPQHTVIMVQVENEPGSWNSVRDYSETGEKQFQGLVPQELMKPDVLKALNAEGTKRDTWQKVFGDRADEYFQAWSIATFIGKVAAAGKAVNPLPLYVNAALRDPLTNPKASSYESGGPTDNVIPIWKAAAPAIDLVAPDIYLSGNDRVLKVIELYSRNDNALFVPEAGNIPENAKYLYEVIARGGIGFSPFGIDFNAEDPETPENKDRHVLYAQSYKAISSMVPELIKWGSEDKIKAVIEKEDQAPQTVDFGSWDVTVNFGSGRGGAVKNPVPNGKALIIKQDNNDFIVIGNNCHITFIPKGRHAGRPWQYLKVEEGSYVKGKFIPSRILNGDETDWKGPNLGSSATILHCTLSTR